MESSMSNKLSAVIAKLQHLKEKYGDLEVAASTQDGAEYNVYDGGIGVVKYTNRKGKTIAYVYIQ